MTATNTDNVVLEAYRANLLRQIAETREDVKGLLFLGDQDEMVNAALLVVGVWKMRAEKATTEAELILLDIEMNEEV